MPPIDPHADLGRRAWVPCPGCRDDRDCVPCSDDRNRSDHWRCLIRATGSLLHLQCPGCTHLWNHETDSGTGDRPF
ncbi:hypothetical protein ACFQ08_16225 [Streptosporangium algeriense]|uniref:Uncharacterized protein n=1 Tax=Streptosporangium algeriense TaxID=1682748 RepID=A0ABW3DSG2_9ACTN